MIRRSATAFASALMNLGACVGMTASSGGAPAPPSNPAVVMVELFTSEGCSSCPPADDLLTGIVRQPPVDGVEVIALSEHVDYWDDLGWRDRFSSRAMTSRQSDYNARVFRGSSIYTPQLVVDGQFQCIGSESGAARQALAKATRLPKATVAVTATQESARDVGVRLKVDVPADVTIRGDADVVVAVTEDRLVTSVHAGENKGRTLNHNAVVRFLDVVGALKPDERTFTATTKVPLAPQWKPENLRIVSFIQERRSMKVLGAGTTRIGLAR